MVNVNRNVRFIRESRGIKQAELAKSVGISQNHLSQIETGKRSVTTQLLERFMEVFDIDLTALLFTRPMWNIDDPKSLSETLRYVREKRGKTVEETAQKVGVPVETYKKWEQNGNSIDVDRLIEVLKALRVSLSFFIGDSDDFSECIDPDFDVISGYSPDDVDIKKERPGMKYWGTVVDRAREASAREDPDEIAEIEHMLKLALRALESVKGQTEMVCQPKCSEKQQDDGAKSA